MNLSVNFKSIEQNIDLLEDEKKKVILLIEQLEISMQIKQSMLSNNTRILKKSIDDLKEVKDSIEFRIHFLNQLVIDGIRLVKDVSQIVNDISSKQ